MYINQSRCWKRAPLTLHADNEWTFHTFHPRVRSVVFNGVPWNHPSIQTGSHGGNPKAKKGSCCNWALASRRVGVVAPRNASNVRTLEGNPSFPIYLREVSWISYSTSPAAPGMVRRWARGLGFFLTECGVYVVCKVHEVHESQGRLNYFVGGYGSSG